jgi:hypothetical protein
MTQEIIAERAPASGRPLLFEAWSKDPDERERQIAMVLGPRRSAKASLAPNGRLPHAIWDERAQQIASKIAMAMVFTPQKRKRTAKTLPPPAFWEEEFERTLPYRPRCADDFELGVYPVRREIALGYRYIQYNTPSRACWLISDIDHAGAADAWRAGKLPMPSLIMENRENEHAHMAWRLTSPVSCSHPLSKPLRYLSAIERGYTRRLDADMAFSMNGLIKNAIHPAWRVTRMFDGAYSLNELAQPLGQSETRLWTPSERISGLGRNVSLFDNLRTFAYREVLCFQAEGDFGSYSTRLQEVASGLNHSLKFSAPLSIAEVRGTVKSVAKWTWRNFSLEAFSERQRQRGIRGMAKRWDGHVTAAEKAAAAGVSLRTWHRRQKDASAQVTTTQRGGTITISGLIGDRGLGATVSNPCLSTANALSPQRRYDRAEQIAPNMLSARIFAPAHLERAPA